MALNTGGTFPESVGNVMITDDAICTHKETMKKKDVAAPSGSAPLKYRMVYPTAPPTHPDSHSSTSVNHRSGLPAHLNASSSGQHLRLYLHLQL
jgi:hypothetical protein